MAIRICQQLILLVGLTLALSNATEDDKTQLEGPLIIPNKEEFILQKGQNYTFFCKGQNPLQFKQQEVPEERTDSLFNRSQRIINSTDYNYEIALDLISVDEYAIGYYACFDDTINDYDVLNKILEEPQNTEHISYIYVYVNGTDKLFAPMREMVKGRNGSKIAIECRPTTPDVNMTLIANNKTQDAKFSSKIGFILAKGRYSAYRCNANLGNQASWKPIRNVEKNPPVPDIIANSKYFIKGENFTMKCNVTYQSNESNKVTWTVPNPGPHVVFNTNVQDVEINSYINNVTVLNAGPEDAGVYICSSTINSKSKSTNYSKVYLEKGFVQLLDRKVVKPMIIDQRIITFKVRYNAYPEPKMSFYRGGKEIFDRKDGKYLITKNKRPIYVQLNVYDLDVTDSDNYTITISNDFESKSVTKDYRIKAAPVIKFEPKTPKKYMQGSEANLVCIVTGYPLPSVQWRANNENYTTQGTDTVETVYKVKSILKVPVRESLNISCEAENVRETRSLLVYEIEEGFGIQNKEDNYQVEGYDLKKTCYASIYDYSNVTWVDVAGRNASVLYSRSTYSHVSTLYFKYIKTWQAGDYTCVGTDIYGSTKTDFIKIFVDGRSSPVIEEPLEDQSLEVKPYQPVSLECIVTSKPRSKVQWTKDGVNVVNGSDNNIEIVDYERSISSVKSTLQIKQMLDENAGKYECIALHDEESISRIFDLVLEEKLHLKTIYGVIGLIVISFTILVLYLIWKVRKEKRFRKELAAAGLLYFKEGRKLNPNLGIDEQAELLPYDDKFEFPREKLNICEPLGSGAYGEVYKAKAQGIINAERSDIVAVKMVKKTADNMCIKALASELKIMVHLGKHVNIVNLLGACTKDVGKRELIVIVEYCEFGNLYHYLQKHREVFIDQLTDNKEKNFGNINRAYSCSTNSGGTNSEYFGRSQTHETEQTFLNTGNSSRSGRRDNRNKEADVVQASEASSYMGGDYRNSNDPSNYSYDGRKPRPLYSRDLLAWAFQIARGMEYLASRKVLHGDLALRNILLAKDNIVKICDFGLARSVYKNDEYHKQENSLLPVKWLAIECMTDRIFSTQSDIWAFGIVLWELFSLAKTPYPNISPSQLLQWLLEGNRLDKPAYADDKLYDVMLQCWQLKPNARPSFSRLQEIIGSFLEENVRNHYVDLNTEYMDLNVKREGEDYLAMVTAPDYNCMVTPSPHHYVNHDGRSFFPPTPTPLPHDDEGYLAMSPANSVFSPRFDGTKFDFDSKILNSERNSHELTPMLTLNNLPARSGSESDQEGNLSPYLKMCPRIEEEGDEVFDVKQNNEKNVSNTAVDNPTYITFTADLEKNPTKKHNNEKNNITNSYINMPNSLVK